ncbi:hypothetical protein Selli2_06940 [Sellimonas catena]|uniref:Uncharacterized protein n=1 Tax=Sellimonas catena TaxID=2994035 RepID=A0A9W6CDD1_9FIRM|nr:hypothetical protein Selli2_06940 [Sellimonas catena]
MGTDSLATAEGIDAFSNSTIFSFSSISKTSSYLLYLIEVRYFIPQKRIPFEGFSAHSRFHSPGKRVTYIQYITLREKEKGFGGEKAGEFPL